MELTLEQALRECAEFNGANGTCWDDPSNIRRMNAARRLIYEQGDFDGTTGWFVANPIRGEFSLPLSFEAVRNVYECDRDIELIESPSMLLSCDAIRRCCSGNRRIHVSKSPVRKPYQRHPGCNFRLGVASTSGDDIGKSIHFEMVTANNRHVRRELKIGKATTSANGLFKDIQSIHKDDGFLGIVTVYAIVKDIDCFVMIEIPQIITHPKVTHFKMGGGCRARQVACYGKRLPLPLRDMHDEMDITSVTALQFAYQALNAISEKDRKAFVELIQLVRGSLNLADQSISEGNQSEDIEQNFVSRIIA